MKTKRPLLSLRRILFVVTISFGLSACGGGTEAPGVSVERLIAEGWTAFETGDLPTATARFADALAQDPNRAEAHTGAGWTLLREREYAGALTAFAAASAGGSQPDAEAGAVLAHAASDDPARVIVTGGALVASSPAYRFAHDTEYTVTDIRWMLGRAGLDTGAFDLVVVQLDILSPGHGLNPQAAGFAEAALALLEAIRPSV